MENAGFRHDLIGLRKVSDRHARDLPRGVLGQRWPMFFARSATMNRVICSAWKICIRAFSDRKLKRVAVQECSAGVFPLLDYNDAKVLEALVFGRFP